MNGPNPMSQPLICPECWRGVRVLLARAWEEGKTAPGRGIQNNPYVEPR